jgi:hypothetical protein
VRLFSPFKMKSIQPPPTTATTDGTTVSNIQLCTSSTSRSSHSCSSDGASNSQSQDDRDNSIYQHPDHHPHHHHLEQYINKKVSPIKIRPVLSAESEGTYSGDSSMLERYPFSSIYLPTSINSSIIIIS